jgi:hypothetical protein
MATGAPNAILAINSLDRYNKLPNNIAGGAGILISMTPSLLGQYYDLNAFVADTIPEPCNNFSITSGKLSNYLIQGYIQRMVVSQIQLYYNIPTVNFGLNDTFWICDGRDINNASYYYPVTIPYGFYTPDELAAIVEIQINATPLGLVTSVNVSFDPKRGFIFESTPGFPIMFPDFFELRAALNTQGGASLALLNSNYFNNVARTYKLLGLTVQNSAAATRGGRGVSVRQVAFDYPFFLYTPYIDIYSDILTNYQDVKDTNTSISSAKGLVARIYLSGVGNPQITTDTTALGSAPFVMTADLNSPKIIRWTPDVAVPSLDFQVRDCYGDLIPGPEYGFSTEWQMTLLCVEGREWNS